MFNRVNIYSSIMEIPRHTLYIAVLDGLVFFKLKGLDLRLPNCIFRGKHTVYGLCIRKFLVKRDKKCKIVVKAERYMMAGLYLEQQLHPKHKLCYWF